jgi:hypothetical protein
MVIATRWADDTFLSMEGLKEDFELMTSNAGMTFFARIQIPTYQDLTYKFLISFEETLATQGENCNVSFNLLGVHHIISFQEFYDRFQFVPRANLFCLTPRSVRAWLHGDISVDKSLDYCWEKLVAQFEFLTLENPKLFIIQLVILGVM